jgi:hypothetical protein
MGRILVYRMYDVNGFVVMILWCWICNVIGVEIRKRWSDV